MNNAVKRVKMYACKKATSTSIKSINNTNATATGEILHANTSPRPLWAIKINEIKLKIIMWPAVMFANKRIISAKGLVKIPTISIGIIIGIKASGTPGGLKICDQ